MSMSQEQKAANANRKLARDRAYRARISAERKREDQLKAQVGDQFDAEIKAAEDSLSEALARRDDQEALLKAKIAELQIAIAQVSLLHQPFIQKASLERKAVWLRRNAKIKEVDDLLAAEFPDLANRSSRHSAAAWSKNPLSAPYLPESDNA